MNLLVLLLLAQVETSSTATSAEIAPPLPVEIDRLADQLLYVGAPLLLPDPPAPAPPPLPPPVTLPPLIVPPPAPMPPIPSPPPAPVEAPARSGWSQRLRSFDGMMVVVAVVVLMVAAGLLSSFVRRQNDRRSVLARLATGSNKLLKIAAALLLLLLIAAWLPSDALPYALLAAALALGWSLRDVLPDLIAGAVLAFERRVRPGMWLAGAGFSGVVERVGLRATWLRDATDRRVAVPNRTLVSNPFTSDDGRWPTREVTLRLEVPLPAEIIRRAIIDAVLASPCTPVTEVPSVQRDGADPSIWHVRARVLDLSFAGQFEGELLERAEAMLVGVADRGLVS